MIIRRILSIQNVSLINKTLAKSCLLPQATSFQSNLRFLSSTTSTNLGRKTTIPEENFNINVVLEEKSILNNSLTLLRYRTHNGDVNDHNKSNTDQSNQKLVVLFGWMLSKDRNMEKYAKLYGKYNFDVLLVKTYPKQLIFPKNGSIKNAQDVLDFIQDKHYSQVLFHGFSIGGYQFGEVLAKFSQNPELAKQVVPLIKACVFDSAVDLNNLPRGFSRAMTRNVILQKMFYFFMVSYLKLFYFVATRYYHESEKQFYAMKHFAVPSLMIVSERDKVGSIESNKLVMDSWIKAGVPVKMKIFKDSKHVCHYVKYPDEYEQEIHELLLKTKLVDN